MSKDYMADSGDQGPSVASQSTSDGWRETAEYVYHDENGNPLFRSVRFERGDGTGREKKFSLERYQGGTWSKGLGDVRRVPYRLHKAVKANRVFIVEGEKDADTLRKAFRLFATTNPMGAGKWLPDYARYFNGKRVVVIPDNDHAGLSHAADVAASLLPGATSVQILNLAGLPEKGDVTDWVTAGGTKEDFLKLADAAQSLSSETLSNWRKQSGLEFEWNDPLAFDNVELDRIRQDLLPGPIGNYIRSLAASTETPIELPTLAVLGVLSCALGGKVKVSPEPGYSEPAHLFLCPTMGSGDRKSSVISAATAPLVTWEEEQTKILGPKIAHIHSVRKTKMALIDRKRKSLKDLNDPKIDEIAKQEAGLPVIPCITALFTADSTSERLEMMLAEQGGRAAVISDEGGAFDIMAGRYSETMNFDVYLKGHAGTAIRVQRVSRSPVIVDSPALTVLMSPQPACLMELRDKTALRGRGLLARFLYALPPSPVGGRTLIPVEMPVDIRGAYNTTIRRLLEWKPAHPVSLSLSQKAYTEWKTFQRYAEDQMAEGGTLCRMRDWGSKLPGAALRVAGILHVADANDLSVLSAEIRLNEIRVAVELCKTLISHAVAVFGLISENPETAKAKRILKWLTGQKNPAVSKRDCYRAHHPHVFDRVQGMDVSLRILEEHNLIRLVQQKTKGRSQDLIEINPGLLEAA